MKFKSLLLAGLAGFALASCGGISGYKTEVAKETFVKDLEKVFEGNLFNVEKPYSYESSLEEGYTLTKKWTKDNKKLYEEKTIMEGSSETKYDSVAKVLTQKEEGYNSDVVSSQKTESTIEYNYVGQIDSGNVYTVDLNAKVYKKDKAVDPEAQIQIVALAKIASVKSFFDKFYESDNAKFFEDGNKFTVEEITNDDSSSSNEYVKEVYQLVVNNNSFECYSTLHRETTELNSKCIVDSYETKILRRKDGLKLESVDLHGLLEVSSLPTIF